MGMMLEAFHFEISFAEVYSSKSCGENLKKMAKIRREHAANQNQSQRKRKNLKDMRTKPQKKMSPTNYHSGIALCTSWFGKHLEREHLQYFLKHEGDVEVHHFLAEALKYKNKHTAKVTARNRRYSALQKMRRSGDYFSEKEMELRDPLLYDHLIGQHQTKEEREEKHQPMEPETKFSSLLLHHLDYRVHKERKKQQEEEEDDMLEEEDTDEEDECDEDADMESVIDSRAKQMFKEEFYSAGYSKFIGQSRF